MEQIRYASIIDNDMVDGNGWVVSLWFQGCPHHCKGCHNPETWSFTGGTVEDLDLVINRLEKAVYANGINRNLSILGGEPLCPENIEATHSIVQYFHEHHPDVELFIWSGYSYEDLMNKGTIYQETLAEASVLIDGPFILALRDIRLKLRGSSNQRIIDLQQTKELGHIVLYEK